MLLPVAVSEESVKSFFHFAFVEATMDIDSTSIFFYTQTKAAVSIWSILELFSRAVGSLVGTEISLPAAKIARMTGIIALGLIHSITFWTIAYDAPRFQCIEKAAAFLSIGIGFNQCAVSAIAGSGVGATSPAIITSAAALLGATVSSICIDKPTAFHLDKILYTHNAAMLPIVCNTNN